MRAWPRQDAGAVRLSFLGGSSAGGLRRGRNGEQRAGLGDVLRAPAIGEEPVMADAVKPLWEHMQEETPDELMRGERHDLVSLRALDAVVLVFEGDAIGAGRDQAAVGDGDAMGVAGEIGQYSGGAGKRRLSILPIIKDLGSRSAILTIRYTGKGARSYGKRTQKGNAIFV
jgi:hypothetical protein